MYICVCICGVWSGDALLHTHAVCLYAEGDSPRQVYLYIYMCVYADMYIFVCVCRYVYMCVCVCVCVELRRFPATTYGMLLLLKETRQNRCKYVYICMDIHTYTNVYVCVCVYQNIC